MTTLHKVTNSSAYSLLPKEMPSKKTTATNSKFLTALENKSKNRYGDILPFDETRFKLQETSNHNDYINANNIIIENNKYIATQAPLPTTFSDFWTMVWESKSNLIVMLTNFVEKNKIKAHCYWPSNAIGDEEVLEAVTVRLTQKTTFATANINYFRLTHHQTQEQRSVIQIQYCDWPDRSVPSVHGIKVLLQLISCFSEPSKPIIMHCSAGIGRTGVLIAIHAYLQIFYQQHEKFTTSTSSTKRNLRHQFSCKSTNNYKHSFKSEHNNPCLFSIVKSMRNQRMFMVQTLEQFEFILSAIKHIITTPNPYTNNPTQSSTSQVTNICCNCYATAKKEKQLKQQLATAKRNANSDGNNTNNNNNNSSNNATDNADKITTFAFSDLCAEDNRELLVSSSPPVLSFY